ncbi:MAG: anti-sigma factor family protein [Bacteroidota bacterium]
MKTEDWKAKMMDYLYDELNPEERKAFEEELAQNQELKEELEAFQSDKEILGNWEDEKVSAPPFFNIYKNPEKNNGQTGLKWFLSIAASLLILMVAAKFTGLEISNQNGEFRIALGQEIQSDNQMDKDEIQQLVNLALTNYEEKLDAERKEDKQELESYLTQQSQQNKKLINNYLTGLQESNVEMMQAYWKESNEQQQVYTENMLTNFAEYIDEQRKEDMDYLFAKMDLMESDKDLFKIETGQLINSLASNQQEEQAY